VALVNPALAAAPELINQDPYGVGWLALLEPDNWARDGAALLEPAAYLEVMRRQAEEEAGRP
jgi:glycine cleavage system H protein